MHCPYFSGVPVARVLLNKQSAEAYKIAFENVFAAVTASYPNFNGGKSLEGITVDFSDAQAQGLRDALGEEFASNILRGCKVFLHP